MQIFKYIEYLEKEDGVNVEFFETEFNELFLLKYHICDKPDFKTNKRFGLNQFDNNLFKINIYKIDENKRHVFLKYFKQKDTSISNSLTSEYVGKLISEDKNNEVISILEFLLTNNYKKLKFKYINEFNFSLMMAMVLSGFSSHCKSRKSFIYSFEKTMIIGEFNRKCDAIYIYENILVIIEFKSNVNKKEDPLEYINDRNYVKHVLSYFKSYEPSVIEGINVIKQIGFEFFGKNKKHQVKITITDDLEASSFNETKEISFEKSYNPNVRAVESSSKTKFINKNKKRIVKVTLADDVNFNQNNENIPEETFIGRKRNKSKKQNQSMY